MARNTKYRIGSGFAPLSPCMERFVVNGYRDPMPLDEQIRTASKIEGLRGIGLDYPYQFNDGEIGRVRSLLTETGFELCTLEVGLYPDRKWKLGTFTAPDPGIRREAIEMSKRGLEVAAELGAYDVLLWPGQDGFDYPFQVDYSESWKLLIDGIGEVASHRPDVKISIEYKPKEPRANIFIRNAGTLLYLMNTIGLPNIGATIDYGHSLVAGENPAESAVLLAREGKLFQVHVNDNYRDWDHDMLVGTVTFWETLEFFYWLKRCDYDGWYVLDVFPYREDGMAAFQQCVTNMEMMFGMVAEIDEKSLGDAMSRSDAVESCKVLWQLLMPHRVSTTVAL